jgi:hypothetical protein
MVKKKAGEKYQDWMVKGGKKDIDREIQKKECL